MNINEQHELLIDYVEGTLPAARVKEVEQILNSSPELLLEVELLRETLLTLQADEKSPVPDHYFTNFLPRIREKIGSGTEYTYWLIPQWVQAVLRPAMAAAVLISVFGLFEMLNPETTPPPIYSLIREFEQHEISVILDETSALTTNVAENILDVKMSEELFGIDASNYQTENEVFALLEEQEAEQVVERLQKKM